MYAVYLNIKKDYLQARIAKDEIKKALLSTLIGAIEIKAKNDGNRAVSEKDDSAIEKSIVSLKESAQLVLSKKPEDRVAQEEIKILEGYLAEIKLFKPPQLTESDLLKMKENFKTIGEFMGFLKSNYPGAFDPKLAQKVYKS